MHRFRDKLIDFRMEEEPMAALENNVQLFKKSSMSIQTKSKVQEGLPKDRMD